VGTISSSEIVFGIKRLMLLIISVNMVFSYCAHGAKKPRLCGALWFWLWVGGCCGASVAVSIRSIKSIFEDADGRGGWKCL
jgi:hypothetical protein